MSLLQQRLVAVGRRVRDDHTVVFTLRPEPLVQENAVKNAQRIQSIT